MIQAFEYTHELAWNVMKDYLINKGFVNFIGSKDSTRLAFKEGLISNGEVWMDMIRARNLTLHTYDETIAESVCRSIVENYFPAMKEFTEKFMRLNKEEIE